MKIEKLFEEGTYVKGTYYGVSFNGVVTMAVVAYGGGGVINYIDLLEPIYVANSTDRRDAILISSYCDNPWGHTLEAVA